MTTNTTNSQAAFKAEMEEWKHMAMMAASASLKNLERAEKAESRLAEIQRGVEGLTRWRITGNYIGDPVEFITHPEGELVYLKYVLALLQPQGQADTSGLPG